MSRPEISVVIAAARDAHLAFALEALSAQTLDADRFEVIVVRDRALPAVPGPQGLEPIEVEAPARPCSGAWRNAGWRHASAPIVAFTDDDCRPAPAWLEALLDAGSEGAFAQGRTIPDPEQTHLLEGLARSCAVGPGDREFRACNIAYPRSTLEALGGFDESFGDPGAAAWDLARRAIGRGDRRVFAERALVWHAVLPRTLPTALGEAMRARERARVLARHPSARDGLRLGLFVSRLHAVTLPLIGALALARRRPVAALLLSLPWVWTRSGSARGRPAVEAISLPRKALVDLAELSATLAGAARERTPIV